MLLFPSPEAKGAAAEVSVGKRSHCEGSMCIDAILFFSLSLFCDIKFHHFLHALCTSITVLVISIAWPFLPIQIAFFWRLLPPFIVIAPSATRTFAAPFALSYRNSVEKGEHCKSCP